MKPWEIIHGKVEKVARQLPENSFDAMLGDPPYGLTFMGRRWDYFVPSALTWSYLERALKPGAPAMLFGGPKTFHRVAVAIEDGGFEPRDLLMWLFAQGYPKNKSLLKPAYEPICLCRKYLEGTVEENVAKWGCGRLAIEESRIGTQGGTRKRDSTRGSESVHALGRGLNGGGAVVPIDAGRYPGNLIVDAPAARLLDLQSGIRKGMSGGGKHRADYRGGMFGGIDGNASHARGDEGGASMFFKVIDWTEEDLERLRFYFTSKADANQRNAGCEELPTRGPMHGKGTGGGLSISDSKREVQNDHPTVKPIGLIRYLAAMILPPPRSTPRRILVPYAGSGSEMIGCMQAGWDEVVGIEMNDHYIDIAKARITKGGVLSGLMDRKLRKRRARPR